MPAKPRGIHSRQEVSKLPASRRVDYQIDNPNPTVHAPDTIAASRFNLVRKFSVRHEDHLSRNELGFGIVLRKCLAVSTGVLGHGTLLAALVYLTELQWPRLPDRRPM